MIYETVRKCADDLNSRWSDLQIASQSLANVLTAVPAQQAIVNNWVAVSNAQIATITANRPTLNGFPALIVLINLAQTNIFNPTFAAFTPLRSAAVGPGGLLPVLAGSADGQISASAGLVEASVRALESIYAECMQEFAEFSSNEGARANLSGIRGSVDDISTYPVFTQDFAFGGGSPAIGGGGQSTPTSLSLTAQRALSDVLGRKPRLDDPKSFLAALTQSFMCKEVEGHTECTWIQRGGATGLTELGGSITGAQASIYQRAKVAYDTVKPLIDSLTPLRTDPDFETIEAVRSIVSTEFQELVNELGYEGGPRVSRVDDLFTILLQQNFPLAPPRTGMIQDPINADLLVVYGSGEVGHLGDQLGMLRDNVNTIDDEQDLTNYLVIQDYLNSLNTSWLTFRPNFLGGAVNYLGTQLILIQRNLSVIVESVAEVSFAMDSVFLGPAERLTVRIDFPTNVAPPMYVADLLTWIETFASGEGTQIIQEGGKIGVRNIVQPLQRLRDLVRNTDGRIRHPGARHPRVRRTLEELGSQLAETARLAATLQ
jgi:hypothetical protein